MTKTTINGSPTKVDYPFATITVGETYGVRIGTPNPADVAQCVERYHSGPTYEGCIHVTPSGDLLAGEADRRAARRAGIDRVRVTVHADVGSDAPSQERRMIELALTLPNTPPMVRIRCLLRAWQLRRECGGSTVAGLPAINDRRKVIMTTLGCTAKEARQYLALSTCPRAVHIAFDWRRLTLDFAAGIAELPWEVQLDIAEVIRAIEETELGRPAKTLIGESLARILARRPVVVLLTDALERFHEQLLNVNVNRAPDKSVIPKIDQVIEQLSAFRDASQAKDPSRVATK